jgi:putative DNA methylase
MNNKTRAIDREFPFLDISKIAKQESWRKEINRPIYHIHKWWAVRLGSVFRGILLGAMLDEKQNIMDFYYKKNNFSDQIIFDPFMGSGTTIGEAVKLGAKAVGCDINPISTYIVNQAFENISESELEKNFLKIESNVKEKIQSFYITHDPETGELIPVLYFFWVKMLECPNNEMVPLFSHYIFSKNAYPQKKPEAQIICPDCWSIFQDRYDAKNVHCPQCGRRFNPQKDRINAQEVFCSDGKKYKIKELVAVHKKPLEHKMYALLALRKNGEKIYLKPTDFDTELYNKTKIELEKRNNFLIPSLEIRPGHNTDQARGYNYFYWKDFFNDRQLLCLSLLLENIIKIKDTKARDQFLCLFSSTLEFNNLFCSFKGEGTGAVRHLFSNHILKPERTPIENSVWGTNKSSGTFTTLYRSRLLKAKSYLNDPFEIKLEKDIFDNVVGVNKIVASNPIHISKVNSWDDFLKKDNSIFLLNGDSSATSIPDKSIDAVVTDPPYFDFINYSELSDFFYAWLAPVLKKRFSYFNATYSAHNAEVQHNNPVFFSRLLANVFFECHRVLKDSGVLIFSFHHSKPEGWAAIYQSIILAGFRLINFYPVHGELTAASPKHAANSPISIDALLICKKDNFINAFDISSNNYTLDNYIYDLSENGFALSENDKFVIEAAILLVQLKGLKLSYEATCEYLINKGFINSIMYKNDYIISNDAIMVNA